jgi:two-component system sensor histidine kinase/response regulator
MMGGRIWVESEPGKGSVFHFTTRCVLGSAQEPKLVSQSPDKHALLGIPVLIVDDNSTNRRILKEIAVRWGMLPTLADDAASALEAMKQMLHSGGWFPLILLDAQMPGVDGFALALAIKQDPALASAAIMMLSSSGLHDDTRRCRELGISAYLVKPINQLELRHSILKVLGATPQPELASLGALVGDFSAVGAVNVRRPLRVLLAEDNAANQKLVLRLLEKRGHSVIVAGDGLRAVEAFKSQSFDLALMDVQMPEVGGFEATGIIRGLESATGRRLPIIALTAHAMQGDRERCLQAGMDDYLSKPIRPRALFEAIDRATSLRGMPNSMEQSILGGPPRNEEQT